jgi:3-oxoacyl-[acyl-carrier-protein] synthase II
MSTDVVVTGLGVWTALGTDPESFFDALCAGESGVGAVGDGMGPYPGKGPVVAIEGGPHRSSALALHAVRQALGGLDPADVDGPIAVVGASTSGDMVVGEVAYEAVLNGAEPGPDFVWAQLCDRPTEIVARELGLTGPRTSVSTACSSGAAAVGIAAWWIRTGRVRMAVAFGTDALCRLTVHGFGALGAVSPERCRPFDPDRTGLSLGEGAGALLLEDAAHAAARGARVRGRITGYGSATDAHHMTAPHPEGRGARQAVADALAEAGNPDLGWWCAHGTSTPLNDAMEVGVIGDVAADVPASSIKGAVGHTLGAAGAVELVATVLGLEQGRIPPNTGQQTSGWPHLDLPTEARSVDMDAAISVNFAFGGHNAAVVVQGGEPSTEAPEHRPDRTGRILDAEVAVPGGLSGLLAALEASEARPDDVETPKRPASIPAGKWRRMSRLARILACTVIPLMERHPDLDWSRMPMVHGTAMGEVVPSSAFLDRMFLEGPDRGSPTSFQNSVYNATSAHLSLVFDLRGPMETLSSGMATGLVALSRAMEWAERLNRPVLVVVGDDRNDTTLKAFHVVEGRPGETLIAVLVGPAGMGPLPGAVVEIPAVAVSDGPPTAGPVFGRRVALPYERGFAPVDGAIAVEDAVGLNCANGLLALLAGAPVVCEQDDALVVTARRDR